MIHHIKKTFRFLKDLTIHFARDFSSFFYKGWQANLIGPYAIAFARSLIFYLNQFRIYLYINGIQQHYIDEDRIQRLQKTSKGLHSLLPADPRLSYSVLIAVDHPRLDQFQQCLKSALNQSAPRFEILIGLMSPPSPELSKILEDAEKQKIENIRVFPLFEIDDEKEAINALAKESSHNYLLPLRQEDWIRPDLLYRFEQTLRLFPEFENKVLYCNCNSINDKGYFIPESEQKRPRTLSFPFLFKHIDIRGMLFPTLLWKKAGGFNLHYKGAENENLLLQLDLLGASFQNIPLSLYSTRASESARESKSEAQLLEALKNYSAAKQLQWKWSKGFSGSSSVRALPQIAPYSVQIVIPYKDQKELTLQCIESVIKQKDISFQITAIDNGSNDLSIAEEIKKVGGEVLTIQEPFNYSRLNNMAVKKTKAAAHCEAILFINNDVVLEDDALSEMMRWIDQPYVGMVGCRLHYPDGRLQHGGVTINRHGREEMRWEHVDKLRRFDEMKISKELGFFDAVTAACALVKRKTFLEIGGFDEVWYPIGYSDTNLAVKLLSKNLRCFYTPYACGIHHESVSRKSAIEDFENSWWLHNMIAKRAGMDER